jgi:hypothetical protein
MGLPRRSKLYDGRSSECKRVPDAGLGAELGETSGRLRGRDRTPQYGGADDLVAWRPIGATCSSGRDAGRGCASGGRGGIVLHLRLICPVERTDEVGELLDRSVGVAHIAMFRGAAVRPAGDVVEADIARECADEVLAG